MGHKSECLRKLSNGWTDWHQVWYKSADSFGNRHRLNTIRPSIPQEGLGGQIQKFGEAVKQLDRLAPNLVHVCGFVLEWTYAKYNNSPLNIPGGNLGVLGGHKFKSMLKLSNGWTDWHQIWHTCADSSGNGYTPNKLIFETQGGIWGFYGVKHSNVWRSCQTA